MSISPPLRKSAARAIACTSLQTDAPLSQFVLNSERFAALFAIMSASRQRDARERDSMWRTVENAADSRVGLPSFKDQVTSVVQSITDNEATTTEAPQGQIVLPFQGPSQYIGGISTR